MNKLFVFVALLILVIPSSISVCEDFEQKWAAHYIRGLLGVIIIDAQGAWSWVSPEFSCIASNGTSSYSRNSISSNCYFGSFVDPNLPASTHYHHKSYNPFIPKGNYSVEINSADFPQVKRNVSVPIDISCWKTTQSSCPGCTGNCICCTCSPRGPSVNQVIFLVDCGLRFFDGTEVVIAACEPETHLNSPLKVSKGDEIFGIALVNPSSPSASKLLIKTDSGLKAIRKLEGYIDN